MTQRKTLTISLTPEIKEELDALCTEMEMKPSEIIREMIEKTSKDIKAKQIILTKWAKRNGIQLNEQQLRIMSIESTEKKAAAPVSGGAVSLNNQYDATINDRLEQAAKFWENHKPTQQQFEYAMQIYENKSHPDWPMAATLLTRIAKEHWE